MDRIMAAKVFIDVAYTGSFSDTAKRLTMSRSMVSRYIEAMEEWFDTRLLHRTTRKIALTNIGAQCLSDVEHWLSETEKMVDMVKPSIELSGTIRIAVSISFGHSQLMPAISEFMTLHPALIVEIELLDTPVDLIENRIDLAIRIASSPDPSLIGKSIAKCRSILVASPDYLANSLKIDSPQDLINHQCLGHKNVERYTWTLYQGEHVQSIDVNCRLIANEATALMQACIHGSGIAVQPIYLVNPYIDSGQLVNVLPEWKTRDMDIFAFYLSRKHLSPAIRSMIDFLSDYFKENKLK